MDNPLFFLSFPNIYQPWQRSRQIRSHGGWAGQPGRFDIVANYPLVSKFVNGVEALID